MGWSVVGVDAALRRERDAEDFTPYIGHVTPEVVLMTDDRVMGMFHLSGVPFETADEDDLNALHTQLNSLLRQIASDRLVVYLHLVRGYDSYYPGGTFRSSFARDLDAQCRRKMLGTDRYRNDLYLSVIRRSPRHAGHGVTKLFRKSKPASGRVLDNAAAALDDTMATLNASLGRYGPHRLGLRAENGVTFTEIGEALRRIMFGNWLPVPLVAGPLGPALYSERVIFGRESIEIRGPGHQAFGAVFGIKEYPGHTYPGQFDAILGAPYRCVLTQSFAFLGKAAAHSILTRKQNQMVSAQDKAASQMVELTEAADQLQSNRFAMGEHHLALMVLCDNLGELPDVAAQARRDLAESGAIVVREDLALEAGYWSQLPGNLRWRVRPAAITGRNFAAMAAMHDYPRGERVGLWGEPIALLQSAGATPYKFHFHVRTHGSGDVGDAVIFGPKGSGKTVFLGFALTMAEKTGARCVLFDKDRGAEIVSRAIGGTYLALDSGVPSGLSPLRALSSTPSNLEFLRTWVTMLVAGDGSLTPGEEKAVEQAVAAIMTLPPHHRSLGELRAMLGQSDPNGIGPRLEKWAAGRALGWVFDNEEDLVQLDAPFVGFDMTKVLDNAEVCGPVMAYLFHRVEALVTGQRLIIAIDEFWKALSFKVFENFAENKIKVIRKQNGIMLFATQSVKDALKSPIGHSIIQECQTQILFPNSKGQPEDYISGINCTPAEYELVTQELPNTRAFLVKQGTASLVAQLDLSGMDDALAVISGRTRTVELMNRLRSDHGDDPDQWLPEFYRLWRSVPA